MSEKLYAEPVKLYPSLRESDTLDLRLKEINSFNFFNSKYKRYSNFL